MFEKKEWIKCSAVAAGFYIAVYVLFAHYFWGYANPWLVIGCLTFAATDIVGLHWWYNREKKDQNDDFYP